VHFQASEANFCPSCCSALSGWDLPKHTGRLSCTRQGELIRIDVQSTDSNDKTISNPYFD